ncbi:hypothetical protein AB0P28_03860 [Pseudarthrobacter sp. NPDC089323]
MTANLSPNTNDALTGLIIFDAGEASDFTLQLCLSAASGTGQWTGVGQASWHTYS